MKGAMPATIIDPDKLSLHYLICLAKVLFPDSPPPAKTVKNDFYTADLTKQTYPITAASPFEILLFCLFLAASLFDGSFLWPLHAHHLHPQRSMLEWFLDVAVYWLLYP